MADRERRARKYVHVQTERGDYFTSPKNGKELASALVSAGERLLLTEELEFTTAREAVLREIHRRPFTAFEGLNLEDMRPSRKAIPLRGVTRVNPRATAESYWKQILADTGEATK